MKPAREVDGMLAVARRIVIGAAIGGIVGVAVRSWLNEAGRSAIGSETGVGVSILVFTVFIGTCIARNFGAVVAAGRAVVRSSRQFRPGANPSLEGRIALSSFAHSGGAEHALAARAAATPSILSIFPLEAASLAAGNTVYERWTTTYFDGLSQTLNESFVLNNETVTVTQNFILPGSAGTETAVNQDTAIPGGVLFQSTVTEPNGQTLTETRTDAAVGLNKVLHNGTIQRPDGVTITFTGNSVRHGARTVVNSSFRESNGISYTVHEVDISQGVLEGSATVTTKWLDGSHQVNKDSVSGSVLSSPPS